MGSYVSSPSSACFSDTRVQPPRTNALARLDLLHARQVRRLADDDRPLAGPLPLAGFALERPEEPQPVARARLPLALGGGGAVEVRGQGNSQFHHGGLLVESRATVPSSGYIDTYI